MGASIPPKSIRCGDSGGNGGFAGVPRIDKDWPKQKDEMRQAGEPAVFLAGSFLLADDGAGRRYLGAERGLPAQRATDPGQLCAAVRTRRTSGQAALVVAYCAAQGPHDQYYFGRPEAMVSGIVRPPAIELANRDLVRAHLHAIWLAESVQELLPDIPHVLDLNDAVLSVQKDIATAFAKPALIERAASSMRRS